MTRTTVFGIRRPPARTEELFRKTAKQIQLADRALPSWPEAGNTGLAHGVGHQLDTGMVKPCHQGGWVTGPRSPYAGRSASTSRGELLPVVGEGVHQPRHEAARRPERRLLSAGSRVKTFSARPERVAPDRTSG